MKIEDIINNFFRLVTAKIVWVLLAIGLIITAGCFYVWYNYIYNSEWSSEKKKNYMQTKEESIALNRGKLDEFIQETNNRELEFQKDLSITSDIFRLKK